MSANLIEIELPLLYIRYTGTGVLYNYMPQYCTPAMNCTVCCTAQTYVHVGRIIESMVDVPVMLYGIIPSAWPIGLARPDYAVKQQNLFLPSSGASSS